MDALKAQEKVNAVKDKLAEAAKLLKDKANKEALTNAKTVLETLKNEETPTGKTADSLAAYTAAKEAAEEEIATAQKILADDNATQEQVDASLTKINAKKEALETAKDKLVDAASQEQKDDLAKAEEKLKLADTTGKTAESIKAYNEAVEKLKADIEAAKKAAKDLLAKGDNAGELEAFRVQAKINALKEKLAEASKLLESVDKAEAKKAIEEAAKNATNGIDANPDLTDAEKAAAKAKVAEEAKKAIDAIDKATTAEAVTKAKEDGKAAIEKAAAKAEIEAAKAAKEKAIDANPDLTPEQKAAAKAKVAEEAKKATDAIDKATTAEEVTKAKEEGKAAIEKAAAKAEIEAAKAAKEKAIDERADLLQEEKEAAKKIVREEADAANSEIDKATTVQDLNKVLKNGKDNIAKVNPVGAKEEAKEAVEEALANKEKEIDESTDLTPEEKVKAKALAREEAKAAKDAIDKATSIEAIEKALRPFLYQIDQDALVFDLPTLDIKEALKSLVQGIVSIEQGKQISDQDVLSKLNLPEGLEVVKIEKPATAALGATSAKVTIKLSDGSYATVEVPVEVVKKSKEDSKTSKNMLPNTGTTETNTGLAGLGLAVLGSLLAVAKRRKKDEE